MTERGVRAEEN